MNEGLLLSSGTPPIPGGDHGGHTSEEDFIVLCIILIVYVVSAHFIEIKKVCPFANMITNSPSSSIFMNLDSLLYWALS